MSVKITGAHDTFGDSTSDGQEASVAASVGHLCNISPLGRSGSPGVWQQALAYRYTYTVLAPKKSAVGLRTCTAASLAEVMFPPALVKVVRYVP